MSEQDTSILSSGKAETDEQKQKQKISASQETHKPSSRLSAGDVSLDFVNTRYPDGFLQNAADLIGWSRDIGLVTEEDEVEFLAEADADPQESMALFTHIMRLREASYRVLLALIHQTSPTSSDIQVLQSMFLQARGHERLASADHHLIWQWEPAESRLTGLYWSLSRSVEVVLTSPLMERVKECPPARGGCGWLFVDKSKNSSRQWCSDETCGSRVRMRRLYARKRTNNRS
jgi:predicted RNA-binding Zn ribbon-like protein